MNDRLVGFPAAWRPSHYSYLTADAQWLATPLRFVLSALGLTLDDIVNDVEKRRWVYQAYKGYCEVKRGEFQKRRAAWFAYLLWCQRQGYPIQWAANVQGPAGEFAPVSRVEAMAEIVSSALPLRGWSRRTANRVWQLALVVLLGIYLWLMSRLMRGW